MPKATSVKTKLIPLGDRVLVRPFKEEATKTSSLKIILPESMTEAKSDHGKVVAVGEGKYVDGKLVPVPVKVGDTVIFSKYSYDEVTHDEEDLYLLKAENLLAVIK